MKRHFLIPGRGSALRSPDAAARRPYHHRGAHGVTRPTGSVVECGGMTPLFHDATCRVEPKRGHVRALPKLRQRLLFCFFIFHFSFFICAQGQTAIDWHGMVGGGGIGPAVGNYQLIGTIGQPVASNPTLDTSTGPNDQASLASGFLSVAVVDTYSTLALISSVNPSGFKDSVLFTASLPGNATGNLVFKTNNVILNTVSVLGAATSVN